MVLLGIATIGQTLKKICMSVVGTLLIVRPLNSWNYLKVKAHERLGNEATRAVSGTERGGSSLTA